MSLEVRHCGRRDVGGGGGDTLPGGDIMGGDIVREESFSLARRYDIYYSSIHLLPHILTREKPNEQVSP